MFSFLIGKEAKRSKRGQLLTAGQTGTQMGMDMRMETGMDRAVLKTLATNDGSQVG